MPGKLVPLVMLPRYTSFVGQPPGSFSTVPLDVTDYQEAVLTVWRGKIRASAVFSLTCQESTDQETWTACAGTNTSGYDPGEHSQGVVTATLKKRWLRMTIGLGAISNPQVTCWAVGHLETRED